jgi:signal recognition particle subunit SRP54
MSKMFKTMGSGGGKMQQRLMSQMGGGQDLGGSPHRGEI